MPHRNQLPLPLVNQPCTPPPSGNLQVSACLSWGGSQSMATMVREPEQSSSNISHRLTHVTWKNTYVSWTPLSTRTSHSQVAWAMGISTLSLDFARVLKLRTNALPWQCLSWQRKRKPHLKKPAERSQISPACTQWRCCTGWPSMHTPP